LYCIDSATSIKLQQFKNFETSTKLLRENHRPATVTCGSSVLSSGTTVSSTNKANHHDISVILLALRNTLTLTLAKTMDDHWDKYLTKTMDDNWDKYLTKTMDGHWDKYLTKTMDDHWDKYLTKTMDDHWDKYLTKTMDGHWDKYLTKTMDDIETST
jgi:hypothetical protein